MRAMVSLLGLVIVVAIVGLLAKKQMTAVAPAPAAVIPGQPAAATPQQQVQQMRQAAEAALQTPRAMPDDSN
ncbi:hypothetical protein ACPWT1_16065 [Ramlibacter sp. MMS24-I3-19]|uniref:hypothetical protein n=1 Tax=Ramlibacter sp. MMS24-I3-19 TaxID=3416606 RepID=UPI003D02AC61